MAWPGAIAYPADLPISQRRAEIAAAIRDHQVVVVAGETGSGKTTQLPKICLELGRGEQGMIGHTQPRRIAARAVAERVAEELGVQLGDAVGYQVRFTDRSGPDTRVKVMTDGILLAELGRDRDLCRYDTLIVDEAHERSLNVDFILGYLRRLLPRRPDLKVVITSATIDVERFAQHFAAPNGTPAPVVEVSGRTYPVQVRYRPLRRPGPPGKDGAETTVDVDQVTGIVGGVEELWTQPTATAGSTGPQDILVFCSGEREIRDAADALSGLGLPQTEILPLFGRLSSAEQHRVFARHPGRRVVVATNVAETSLTVPGIRYVVDAGTARISRYSQRLKVQRLPIEPISRASADQRSGRCGRLADGIAIRLYSEEDYLTRPEFTEPEILRTNLASVILAMTSLRLGPIERFPFVEPPDGRQVADGMRLLTELQAVTTDGDPGPEGGERGGGQGSRPGSGRGDRRGDRGDGRGDGHGDGRRSPRPRLTPYGTVIAALPVDPRLARMVVEAERTGALSEVLVIVAALSMQDPRERPADRQTQADQSHARFREGAGDAEHPSDFLVLLTLWDYLRRQQRELSGSAFRRMCQREYLHYLRVREWQDLHGQLRQACRSLGLRGNSDPASPDQVHQALLAGLLSHVGLYDRDKREYLGARGARFVIQPGSVLHRVNPDWVMSAELVETSQLWARTNARTDPEWVERAAQHLVKRSYAEPRWSRRRASVVADERVTLYGVPLVAGRPVPYGRIDPEVARELFVRHALVEGDWDTRHEFFHANRRLVQRLSELEARARRRDILVDDETLVAFYDARVPAEVVSGAHFDTWWKAARREEPDRLTFTEDLLVTEAAGQVSSQDYPGTWPQGELELDVTYQFEPGSAADGVTVHVPVELLNRVRPEGFDWQVPGLREDLVTALVRSLPKTLRRSYVPAPDHARQALAAMGALARGLPGEDTPGIDEALAGALTDLRRGSVRAGDVDWSRVPDHLRVTFRVERRAAARGRGPRPRVEVLGEGKDLRALQQRLAPEVRTTLSRAAAAVERSGLTTWTEQLGTLPETFEQKVAGRTVLGYPALVDEGGSVAVRVLGTRSEAERATRLGVRRLLLLGTAPPWKRLLALLTTRQKLALGLAPHGSVPALLEDALACAVDSVVAEMPGGTVRSREAFDTAQATVRQQAVPRVTHVVEQLVPILETAREVSVGLTRLTSPAAADLATDLRRQRDELVRPGFVAAAGYARLPRLVVYLRAMAERLDKGPQDVVRDRHRTDQVHQVEHDLTDFLAGLPEHRRTDADVLDVVWSLQELRVSLFAQRLGTSGPVSAQRIYAAMDRVEDATSA